MDHPYLLASYNMFRENEFSLHVARYGNGIPLVYKNSSPISLECKLWQSIHMVTTRCPLLPYDGKEKAPWQSSMDGLYKGATRIPSEGIFWWQFFEVSCTRSENFLFQWNEARSQEKTEFPLRGLSCTALLTLLNPGHSLRLNQQRHN